MPWSEEEFRRALADAADGARPDPGALGMLRARARRRERARTFGYTFVGVGAAAALIVVGLTLRPTPRHPDVELAGPAGGAAAGSLTRAPVVREDAGGGSILPEMAAGGRYVVFMSDAALVPSDTNGVSDTYVKDVATGTIGRVSVSSSGEQGNAASLSGSISADGRFVAFRSFASNLVDGDSNGVSDIFLRDRSTGTTARISMASKGSQANGGSDSASISADGGAVAFRSAATNLVSGDTNGIPDIFVVDTRTLATTRVSISSGGRQTNGDSRNPVISGDGFHVAFSSIASTLVDGDTNHTWDVFIRDFRLHSIERASLSSKGIQGNLASVFPSISYDGNVVGFVSSATNLVRGDTNGVRDVFLHWHAGATDRVSFGPGVQANGASLSVALDRNAEYVAFSSNASNLVPGDTNGHRDVFVVDVFTHAITLVSRSSDGTATDADSGGPSISADGRFIAYQSFATTLSPSDHNGSLDVYVSDRVNHTTSRASLPAAG